MGHQHWTVHRPIVHTCHESTWSASRVCPVASAIHSAQTWWQALRLSVQHQDQQLGGASCSRATEDLEGSMKDCCECDVTSVGPKCTSFTHSINSAGHVARAKCNFQGSLSREAAHAMRAAKSARCHVPTGSKAKEFWLINLMYIPQMTC